MKEPLDDLLDGLIRATQAITGILALLLVGVGVVIYLLLASPPSVPVAQRVIEDSLTTSIVSPATVAGISDVVDGKDAATGLLDGEGLLAVKANCLACHSAKLVTQNRFTRQGWHDKIVWMQETQGLWDLGENEPIILDYLAKYYAPEERASRRQPLTGIEWYELKD